MAQNYEDIFNAINSLAASYFAPVTSTNKAFLGTAHGTQILNPAFIDFIKKTPCTEELSNDKWQKALEQMGYDSADILPFDGVKLNPDEEPLKIRIAGYAKNHPKASLYEAIEGLLSTYDEDGLNNYLEELVALYQTELPVLKNLFKEAYTNRKIIHQAQSLLPTQLQSLFKNNQVLLDMAARYITQQKAKLAQLLADDDYKGLEDLARTSNLVSAIGAMIKQDSGIKDSLKKEETTKGIALLAEKISQLGSSPKAHAINQALTKVLTHEPNMTFDSLLREIDHADQQSPLGELKTAMGIHRGLLSRIINYFYPLTTDTMRLFKDQIQKSNVTEEKKQDKPFKSFGG